MSDEKKAGSLSSPNNGGAKRKHSRSGSGSGPSSEDESRRQSLYVGGSEHSGQQVLGPKRSVRDDFISRVFEAARQHGAEVVHSDAGQSTDAGGAPRQVVSGYRLGDFSHPSQPIQDSGTAAPGAAQTPTDPNAAQTPTDPNATPTATGLPLQKVKLVMWEKGFTVDDGPFREFRDESNRAFMESIMAGRIPAELQRAYPGHEIDMQMERSEVPYKPPPAHPFSGSGHRLGEIVPTVVGAGVVGQKPKASNSNSSEAAADAEKGGMSEERGQAEIQLKPEEPITRVQLRFPDGRRITGRFNLSHTIQDIRTFIIAANPQMAFQPFVLMNSYPCRCLAVEDSSIKDLGLQNCLIFIKLVN